MTDRELLKLAAKAAGMPQTPKGQEIPQALPVVFTENGKPWNPLTDDGDAFRLAVRLQLEPEFGSGFVSIGQSRGNNGEWRLVTTEFDPDPLAATRRAIVRAAAQIGRSMK